MHMKPSAARKGPLSFTAKSGTVEHMERMGARGCPLYTLIFYNNIVIVSGKIADVLVES